MHTIPESGPLIAGPVEAVRVSIWRLFEEGYLDEDMTTAGLLAVDVGARRARRNDALLRGQKTQATATTGRRRA